MKFVFEINVTIRNAPSNEVPAWATTIIEMLSVIAQSEALLQRKVDMTDKSLDEVLQDLNDEKTQVGGLVSLTTSIKQKLDDALSGVTLPPAAQAKVNAIFDQIEANKQAIMDGINVNTDAQGSDPTAPAGGGDANQPTGDAS